MIIFEQYLDRTLQGEGQIEYEVLVVKFIKFNPFVVQPMPRNRHVTPWNRDKKLQTTFLRPKTLVGQAHYAPTQSHHALDIVFQVYCALAQAHYAQIPDPQVHCAQPPYALHLENCTFRALDSLLSTLCLEIKSQYYHKKIRLDIGQTAAVNKAFFLKKLSDQTQVRVHLQIESLFSQKILNRDASQTVPRTNGLFLFNFYQNFVVGSSFLACHNQK